MNEKKQCLWNCIWSTKKQIFNQVWSVFPFLKKKSISFSFRQNLNIQISSVLSYLLI